MFCVSSMQSSMKAIKSRQYNANIYESNSIVHQLKNTIIDSYVFVSSMQSLMKSIECAAIIQSIAVQSFRKSIQCDLSNCFVELEENRFPDFDKLFQ